jgi:Rieske Fe-S protein
MGSALVGLPAVGVGLVALGGFLSVPERAFSGSVKPDEVPAGLVADLEDGVPQPILFGDGIVFVIKLGDSVRAYSGTCTHAGCLIEFKPQHGCFICPCHEGMFDLRGRVISGPPPRGLFEHEVRISMGRVIVGKRMQ